MPDPRSALKEFRYLEQKRAALGLTLDEEYRLAELRDLVGPELERASRPTAGFDVNAAAARLREALSPAASPEAGALEDVGGDEAELLLDAVLLGGEVGLGDGWEAGAHAPSPPWESVPPDPTATYAVPEPRWGAEAGLDHGAAAPEPDDPFAAAAGWEPGAYTDHGAAPLDAGGAYAEQGWEPGAYADHGAAPTDAAYAAEPGWDPAYVDPDAPSAAVPGWGGSAPAGAGAAPLDPDAAYAEQGWEPGAYADPYAAPLDPDAPLAAGPGAYADPFATASEPGAEYRDDPSADPGAYADPFAAAAADPDAAYSADPDADPGAYVDPFAGPADPDAVYSADPDADPGAYADPYAAAAGPGAAYTAEAGGDPGAYADPGAALHPDAPHAAGQGWETGELAEPYAAPSDPGAAHVREPDVYADPDAPLDAGAAQAADQGWEPTAYVDPGDAPLEPDAAFAADHGWHPAAYVDPGAAALDRDAPRNAEQGWSTGAEADLDAAPVEPGAAPPAAHADPDAACAAEQGWDPGAYAEPGAGPLEHDAASVDVGWDPAADADLDAAPLELAGRAGGWVTAGEPTLQEPPPAPFSLEDDDAPTGASPDLWPARQRAPNGPGPIAHLALEDDPSAEPLTRPAPGEPSELPPDGWEVSGPPPTSPLEVTLGDYDDLGPARGGPSLGSSPDPEPARASAPGETFALGEYDELAPAPRGGPSVPGLLDDEGPASAAPPGPPVLGEYDDTSGFEAPAGAFARPGDELELGPATPAPDAADATQPGQLALEPEAPLLGFELESGGSFEAAADATVPDWARASGAAGLYGSARPLALDLGPDDAQALDAGPTDAGPTDEDPLELEDAVLDADEAGAVLEHERGAGPAPTEPAPSAAPIPLDAGPAVPLPPEPAPRFEPLPPPAHEAAGAPADPAPTAEPAAPEVIALGPPEPDPFTLGDDGEPSSEPEPSTTDPDALAEPGERAPPTGDRGHDLPGGAEPSPLDLDALLAGPADPGLGTSALAEDLPPLFTDGDLGDAAPTSAPAPLPGRPDAPAPAPVAPAADLAFAADRSWGAAPSAHADPARSGAARELEVLPGLEADVDLDDLPMLEGDLLEELPPEELVPLPEAPRPGAPLDDLAALPPWSWPELPPEEPSGDPASPAPVGALARASAVPGAHRVVIHTAGGQARRGLLEDADLAAETLLLLPNDGGPPEPIPTAQVKAVFFMLAQGAPPPAPEGRRVHVTFHDGRRVAGFSPDYADGCAGFFMVPAEARANTGRIWVYESAVKQVVVGSDDEGRR